MPVNVVYADIDESITFDVVGGQPEAVKTLSEFAESVKFSSVHDWWNIKPKGGVLLAGPPGTGKAQPYDANILTPFGYVQMGNLQINDYVIDSSGNAVRILGIFEQGEKEVYRVTFSDGSSTECCSEHLWNYKIDEDRVKKLEIWRTSCLKDIPLSKSPSIPLTKPVVFKTEQSLPLDPYLLGLLLGDGGLTLGTPNLTTIDDEIINAAKRILGEDFSFKKRKCTYSIRDLRRKRGQRNTPNRLTSKLREIGVWNKKSQEKFIPKLYLTSSPEDRLSLIQGLLDTDGTISNGTISFCTTSPRLLEDMIFLVESLGGSASRWKPKIAFYRKGTVKKVCLPAFQVGIQMPENLLPFRLTRKLEKIQTKTKYPLARYFKSVELVGSKPCRCIAIDSPEQLYLTDNCIVTHNTLLVKALANECGATFIEINYTEVASMYVDKPLENVRKILRLAEAESKKNHVVLFLDEIDSFLPARNSSAMSHETENRRVSAFLTWMDGGLEARKNITIIGATNRLDAIDPAAKRPGRFDIIVEFQELTPEARIDILKIHINKRLHSQNGIKLFEELDLDKLTNFFRLNLLSGAEIEEGVKRALETKASAHRDAIRKDFLNTDIPEEEIKISLSCQKYFPGSITTEELIESLGSVTKTHHTQTPKERMGF